MHVPPAFREDDLDTLRAIMRQARLCQFITATVEGPIATPLPMFLDPHDGRYGVLYGHLARSNPQWQVPVIGEALATFMGPDAYISAGWYPSKQEHGKVVPTWNYEAVQAYGPVEFFEDAALLLEAVTRLTDLYESTRPNRWWVGDAPEAFTDAQLKGIVGVRLPIVRLIGKRKMSQNRSIEDRRGVVEALATSERPQDREVAALIPAGSRPEPP